MHGDSWFDYPLGGTIPGVSTTDIIAELGSMGNINPMILNVSHYGDTTTDELSLSKQQRIIMALRDSSNWLESGRPDAVLFSGGGNDVAGEQFCIFLDYAGTGVDGLNIDRLNGAPDMVVASYKDLFLFRDRFAPGVPIFGHCYDFAIPNGVPAACIGPWLQPSLQFCGINDLAMGTAIVKQVLLAFKQRLFDLSQDTKKKFNLIDTQKTLQPNEWANELHPTPGGFIKIAAKFVTCAEPEIPWSHLI